MSKSARIACTVFFLFFLPLKIFAWNAIGHMIVANIAYENLKPSVRHKIDTIISSLTEQYPDIQTFQQAAFWPDAIRGQQIETYTHWHYIDNAISTDGSPLKNLVDTDNASWAYHNVVVVVKNDRANQYERTRFLSFLEHITGDLHQPLHAVSNITAKNENGDKGGNLFNVIYRNSRMNLHKLWDDGLGEFEGSTSMKHIDELTREITNKYPSNYFRERATQLDQQTWINESVELAKNYVYTTVENQVPSDAYFQSGREVAKQQVALAGYRLANVLNQLLS